MQTHPKHKLINKKAAAKIGFDWYYVCRAFYKSSCRVIAEIHFNAVHGFTPKVYEIYPQSDTQTYITGGKKHKSLDKAILEAEKLCEKYIKEKFKLIEKKEG